MACRTIKVSKLDAAGRQLDCALELWFHDKDEVSIHTLASAAYQIVHDINVANGSPRDLIYDTFWIKDEYRREFVNVIKKPANFFKHADNDPNPTESIEFAPDMSMAFLMCVYEELRHLKSKLTDIQIAYLMWLVLQNPKTVKPNNVALKRLSALPAAERKRMRSLPKADVLKAVLSGLADGRRKREHKILA